MPVIPCLKITCIHASGAIQVLLDLLFYICSTWAATHCADLAAVYCLYWLPFIVQLQMPDIVPICFSNWLPVIMKVWLSVILPIYYSDWLCQFNFQTCCQLLCRYGCHFFVEILAVNFFYLKLAANSQVRFGCLFIAFTSVVFKTVFSDPLCLQ